MILCVCVIKRLFVILGCLFDVRWFDRRVETAPDYWIFSNVFSVLMIVLLAYAGEIVVGERFWLLSSILILTLEKSVLGDMVREKFFIGSTELAAAAAADAAAAARWASYRAWVRMWRVIMSRRQAAYGHCGHLYGFSPVCVRWCVDKWSERENTWLQTTEKKREKKRMKSKAHQHFQNWSFGWKKEFWKLNHRKDIKNLIIINCIK